jgi:hypothetical protein
VQAIQSFTYTTLGAGSFESLSSGDLSQLYQEFTGRISEVLARSHDASAKAELTRLLLDLTPEEQPAEAKLDVIVTGLAKKLREALGAVQGVPEPSSAPPSVAELNRTAKKIGEIGSLTNLTSSSKPVPLPVPNSGSKPRALKRLQVRSRTGKKRERILLPGPGKPNNSFGAHTAITGQTINQSIAGARRDLTRHQNSLGLALRRVQRFARPLSRSGETKGEKQQLDPRTSLPARPSSVSLPRVLLGSRNCHW